MSLTRSEDVREDCDPPSVKSDMDPAVRRRPGADPSSWPAREALRAAATEQLTKRAVNKTEDHTAGRGA